jgi:hypothetical protein
MCCPVTPAPSLRMSTWYHVVALTATIGPRPLLLCPQDRLASVSLKQARYRIVPMFASLSLSLASRYKRALRRIKTFCSTTTLFCLSRRKICFQAGTRTEPLKISKVRPRTNWVVVPNFTTSRRKCYSSDETPNRCIERFLF